MYFGVVPVILLFIPFKLITGKTLITYHATQIFIAFFIIGLFAFFGMLTKKGKYKISLSVYTFMSVSLSLMSVWYISSAPALYCTAISAGICMMIWSLYFFYKAVYMCDKENKSILYAFLGSLFGALTFGCRPPIGIANIIAIPMYIDFLKNKKFSFKFLLKNIIIFIPYIIIGAALMYYNYIRFDNIFEFGQSYQLTVADQHNYGNLLSRFNIKNIIYSFYYFFLKINSIRSFYEFVNTGCLITYPIILLIVFLVIKYDGYDFIKNHFPLKRILITSSVAVVLIVVFSALCSPYPIARYRTDFIWLIAIIIFILLLLVSDKCNKSINYVICFICFITICLCVILFLSPNDYNITQYYPQSLELIKKVLSLGFCF